MEGGVLTKERGLAGDADRIARVEELLNNALERFTGSVCF